MASPYSSRSKKTSSNRWLKLPEDARVVIIGNGMVGAQLCQYLVENELYERFDVTVIGAEPLPAYDRIRLSTFVDHRDPDALILKPRSWYEEHGIKLITGVTAEKIDRQAEVIEISEGEPISYDAVVIATGSRPFVPPIPGADLPNVFLYRTIADLEEIIAAAEGKKSAVIIGGGLLGLEAAQALQKLGLAASVVERANFLMPQQLNEKASALLEAEIREQDIEIFLAKSRTEIEQAGQKLKLTFERGEDEEASSETDLVIISAGIAPNSELASKSGLRVGTRGGVIVDDQLQTDDERIFAVGECALLNGRVYGLAAPGYAMAKHVAKRIAGEKTTSFPKPDLSTRLKMLGIDVVTIGDPLEEGRRIEFETDDHYRMLVVSPRNQLLGGLGVGEWPEAGRIQSLFAEEAIIRVPEQSYFSEEGVLSGEETALDIGSLPDKRIICNCMSITKGELVTCLAKCGPDADKLAIETGASTVCGSCRPLLDQLCGAAPSTKKPLGYRALLGLSAAAVVAVLVTLFMPGVELADSVESWQYKVDQFWRDNFVKQMTGFVLMGVAILGTLISLRKRFTWFRFGHFAKWRVFHAAFGITSLVVLFIHTGFHFGHNLNFWLMFTFVGLNLLGALAGVVSAIESSGTSKLALAARQIRPVLTYAHLVLFWPLPVLLTFHILSVYLY